MVTSLARQAVIIKSGNDTSILTGNYELAYALGFLSSQMSLSFPEGEMNLQKLHKEILEEAVQKETADEKLRRLIRMVRLYQPTEEQDGQMEELFRMGLSEKYPWDLYHM